MHFAFDPLTLILVIVAAIVFWRLRSVLGQRTGLERPAPDFERPAKQPQEQPHENQPDLGPADAKIRLPVWQGHAAEGSPTAKALEAIVQKQPDFTVPGFLSGASSAYEWILEAFAKGDKQALKSLLAKEVFQGFSDEIDARNKRKESMRFQYVGTTLARLEGAELAGNLASLTVNLAADVISARQDEAGRVVDGDEKAIRQLKDTWVFERDITSRDPNWKLVSTGDAGA